MAGYVWRNVIVSKRLVKYNPKAKNERVEVRMNMNELIMLDNLCRMMGLSRSDLIRNWIKTEHKKHVGW